MKLVLTDILAGDESRQMTVDRMRPLVEDIFHESIVEDYERLKSSRSSRFLQPNKAPKTPKTPKTPPASPPATPPATPPASPPSPPPITCVYQTIPVGTMPNVDLTLLIDYTTISSSINNRLINEVTACTPDGVTTKFSVVSTCATSSCSTDLFKGIGYPSTDLTFF